VQSEQLNHLADQVLEALNSGRIDFDGPTRFGGVRRDTANWRFKDHVQDLAGSKYPEELQEHLQESLPSISSERRKTLSAHPELITECELSVWLQTTGVFDQIFELGFLFPLTQDKRGPCVIAGTYGDQPQPDYELFVVAQTPTEAAKLWQEERLGALQLYTRRG
jgi:hypothetical protein